MTTFTVQPRGQQPTTFESSHSDSEIAEKLAELTHSNFAQDLAASYRHYGSFTDRQRPWAHKLVHDAENRKQPSKFPGFDSIYQHLHNCRKSREDGGAGLLKPLIVLQVGEQTIALKYTISGRNRGKVSVAQSHRYGEGRFYGWIDADGYFEDRAGNDAVLSILERVAADPTRVISEIGRETGLCCYCLAPLSQVQSKIAGCGKRCSENYHVHYPNAAETREHIADHPEVLVGASDADRWS